MTSSAPPNRLVVMAAYDPDGELAEHVRYQIEAWQGECARLIVVVTNRLTLPARTWLEGRAELIERENTGRDFYSYRVGLLAAGDLASYDHVVICNDTFVGPLIPFSAVFAKMSGRFGFWGITRTRRIKPHVQSFFVVFEPEVVACAAFAAFWADVDPTADRRRVIRAYEVGLSRRLKAAGFGFGSYFNENRGELRLARLRVWWWALCRQGGPRAPRERLRQLRSWGREPWNPMAGLADAALRDARLPVVKLDTLRFDPYGLGAGRLLKRCQRTYPDAFRGIERYLARTARAYPQRPNEALRRPVLALRPFLLLVGYR